MTEPLKSKALRVCNETKGTLIDKDIICGYIHEDLLALVDLLDEMIGKAEEKEDGFAGMGSAMSMRLYTGYKRALQELKERSGLGE